MKKILILSLLIIVTPIALIAAEIQVNTNSGSASPADDGFCTFHEAIIAANTNTASGVQSGECAAGEALPIIDQVTFASVILPTTIALEVPFELIESAIINGPHKELLTLSSIGTDRVGIIRNIAVADFTIKGVTIAGGYAGVGTAPDNTGGGILVSLASSTLLLEKIRFTNNSAEYAGGALSIAYGGTMNNFTSINQCEFDNNASIGSVEQISGNTGGGGAIFIGANQTVEILNSTFYDNSAQNTTTPTHATGDSMGGAIWMLSSSPTATSELTIDTVTIDSNQAYGVGGAISIGGPGFPDDYSLVHIKHATITRNTADANSSNTGGAAGGIFTSASTPVDIFNNVLAKNNDNSISNNRPNLSGAFNTLGHNFMNGNEGNTAGFPMGEPNIFDDIIVSSTSDPGLHPLINNGGPTLTRALMSNSPLYDQGQCKNKLTDQRGYYNPSTQVRIVRDNLFDRLGEIFSDGCDIGAVEYSASESNAFPDGMKDTFNILEDSTITLASGFNVLDNDIDIEGEPLVVLNAGLVSTNSSNINNSGDVDLWTDGQFTYSPPTDEFGTLDYLYIISDGENESASLATINVLPVNDTPSFDSEFEYISIVGTNDIAGIFNYPDWAFNIKAGPDNESDQNMQFIIQVSGDTQIFATAPTVSLNGALVFNIALNALGSADISVKLQDNGGTDNGGVNISNEVIVTVYANLDTIFKNSFENNDAN